MPTRGTKHHAIRIDDALWAAARAKAITEGVNLSDLIRDALRDYIQSDAPGVEEVADVAQVV